MPVLRFDHFKSTILNCSILIDNNSDLHMLSQNTDFNEFETRLSEAITESQLLKYCQNTTFNIEYFLKVTVYGRDGNELRMPADESVVLTELAMIDNTDFTITRNNSLKAPRRFFRIGIGQVKAVKTWKFNDKICLEFNHI